MRALRWAVRLVLVLLALAGLIAVAAGIALTRGGISANAEPGPLETRIARQWRSLAIPSHTRNRANPVPFSQEVYEDGLAHFADHCASCHANDGSGQTTMGRGLYPRVPDMRRPATQNLSDGELFYIIENGVKLTGMPAWSDGTPEGEKSSWHLVHFIRRLPALTEDDLGRMRSLNPRSPEEIRQEEEERRFLEGEPATPKPPTPHKHGGNR